MKYSSRYLLLLLFFSLHSLTFSYNVSVSNLNKGDSKKLKIGTNNYFYLDLSQFEKDYYIYFKVKLEYGYFRSSSMHYEGFDDTSYTNEPVLTQSQYYYSYSNGSYYSGLYYYSYAYYYKIKKPSTKYLFVSTPGITLDAYYGNAYISNEGVNSTAANVSVSNLNKGDSRKLKIGYLNYFYLDLSQFEKDDYIYFKVKLEYGYFRSSSMHYEGFDDTSYTNEPVLSHSQYYYSFSSGSYYSGLYYYSYAYYYKIKKPSTKYLFVSTPGITLDAYYGNAYISNEGGNSTSSIISNEGGLSTAAIIGICVAVIVAIVIASMTAMYFVRRARRASYISPPVAVYAPPVTPLPTYY